MVRHGMGRDPVPRSGERFQGNPGIIITTSRRPSPRSRSLVKDLVSVIPGSVRLTRGHNSYEDLAREALVIGADRVVVVGDRKGNPGVISVYAPLKELRLESITTFILLGVKLSRESGAMRPREPKVLVVEADDSSIAEEFSEELMRAFHARLKPPGSVEPVIARLDKVTEDSVRLAFYWQGRLAGPVLRLKKPGVMVK